MIIFSAPAANSFILAIPFPTLSATSSSSPSFFSYPAKCPPFGIHLCWTANSSVRLGRSVPRNPTDSRRQPRLLSHCNALSEDTFYPSRLDMTTTATSGSASSQKLVFINASCPLDAKPDAQKRAIRSAAARSPYPKKVHVSQGKTHGQQRPTIAEQVERSEEGIHLRTSVLRSTDLKTRVKRPHKSRSKRSRYGVKVDVKMVESTVRAEGNSIVNNQTLPSAQDGHPWMSRGIRTTPFKPFAYLKPDQLHIWKLICGYSSILYLLLLVGATFPLRPLYPPITARTLTDGFLTQDLYGHRNL